MTVVVTQNNITSPNADVTALTVGTANGLKFPNAGPLSNRNLIINGAMQVWQRSTSVAGVADNTNEGYQSVDRFGFSFASTHGGACTISKDPTVPSGEGFASSYNVDITSSSTPTANQNTAIFTKIEAQDIANSGWNFTSTSSYITLSFWARSTKAGTYCAYIDSVDAATYIRYIKEYTLVANTWKKVEITIPGESTLVYNNDNGEGLNVFWVLSAGSNRNAATDGTWQTGVNVATSNQVNFFDSTSNDFYLTGVQLEVGTVATPFEHRSYGDELLRCQRYYCQSVPGSRTATSMTNEMLFGRGESYLSWTYPVIMRAVPSVVTSNDTGTGVGYYTVSSVNNYTNGTVLRNGVNQYALLTPSSNASYNTKTGYNADAEL